MPEYPVNTPLTPDECVGVVFTRIGKLTALGLHESCALKLVAHEYGIKYNRLLYLWLNQEPDGE